MKKSVQKLTLHRETLRRLADEPLEHVGAGAPATAKGQTTGSGAITDCIEACL